MIPTILVALGALAVAALVGALLGPLDLADGSVRRWFPCHPPAAPLRAGAAVRMILAWKYA
jgi:hypothetical protein